MILFNVRFYLIFLAKWLNKTGILSYIFCKGKYKCTADFLVCIQLSKAAESKTENILNFVHICIILVFAWNCN